MLLPTLDFASVDLVQLAASTNAALDAVIGPATPRRLAFAPGSVLVTVNTATQNAANAVATARDAGQLVVLGDTARAAGVMGASDADDSSLSTGALAAVIAVGAALLLAAFVLVFVARRRRQQRAQLMYLDEGQAARHCASKQPGKQLQAGTASNSVWHPTATQTPPAVSRRTTSLDHTGNTQSDPDPDPDSELHLHEDESLAMVHATII